MAKKYLICCCLKQCFISFFSFWSKLMQASVCLCLIYHDTIYFNLSYAETCSNIEVEAWSTILVAKSISCSAWHVRCVPTWSIINHSTKEWICRSSELEASLLFCFLKLKHMAKLLDHLILEVKELFVQWIICHCFQVLMCIFLQW